MAQEIVMSKLNGVIWSVEYPANPTVEDVEQFASDFDYEGEAEVEWARYALGDGEMGVDTFISDKEILEILEAYDDNTPGIIEEKTGKTMELIDYGTVFAEVESE